MDKQAVAHLRDLVARYPYFHSARILLLQALYRSHDASYNAELRASSLLVPNRQAIFHLVEEKNYSAEEERKKYDEESMPDEPQNRTENLIDQFLQSLPAEQQPSSPMPVDATQDYIGFLLQQEHTETVVPAQPIKEMAGGDIIDDFLDKGPSRITLTPEASDAAPVKSRPAVTSDDTPSDGFLTETLAGIYIKQGKYESAAKIIRGISLNNPKKSRYFADQLRFLEKLIINNKNK